MHRLRPYRDDDIEAMANILADGWRLAYAGFIPEAVMARRADPRWRIEELRCFFAEDFDPATEHIMVAEDGVVDGFIHLVLGDRDGLGAAAFVSLLHVRPARIGQGLGRMMMAAGADWLGERVSGPVALSSYALNPYRRFYDRIGGREARRNRTEVDGHAVEVVLYLWDSPRALRAGVEAAGGQSPATPLPAGPGSS